jgi:hypothetical protein
MTSKQTDTVAMTEEQLDTVAGGAPHYNDFRELVGGTMCSARASKQPPAEQNKRPIWQRER